MLDDREDSEYEDNSRFLKIPPKAVLVQYFDPVEEDGEIVEKRASGSSIA